MFYLILLKCMLHGYNPDEFWGEKLFFKGATDSTEPED